VKPVEKYESAEDEDSEEEESEEEVSLQAVNQTYLNFKTPPQEPNISRPEPVKVEPKVASTPSKPKSPAQSAGWSDNDDDEFLDPESGTGNEEDIDLDALSLGDGGHQD
jgi:hypothetical protein